MANDLTAEQVTALLGKLSTDDAFRKLFVDDLGKALAELPGKPGIPDGVKLGGCLRPAQLASKEQIGKSLATIRDQMVGLDSHIPKLLEAK